MRADEAAEIVEHWRALVARINCTGPQIRTVNTGGAVTQACPLPIWLRVRGLPYGASVVATMRTRHRDAPHDLIEVVQTMDVFEWYGDALATDRIRDLVQRLWVHEMNEWFRVDGRLINDEHRNHDKETNRWKTMESLALRPDKP